MSVQPSVVAVATVHGSGTQTVSITPTGTNRLVIAMADFWEAGDPFTTATCDGVPMTEIAARTVTPNRYRVWAIIPTSTSAQNVSFVSTGGGTVAGIVVALSGVDQSTPLGTPVQANGVSTTATVDVPDTLASDLIIDNVSMFGGNSGTVGAGQTSRAQLADGNSRGVVSTEPGNAGTVTMSWSLAGSGGGNDWATVAFRVRAAQAPTFYCVDAYAPGSKHLVLQAGGNPPDEATTSTRWTVGTTLIHNYARMLARNLANFSHLGTPVFSGVPQPFGPLQTTPYGDSYRTGRYRGTIPAGVWYFSLPVIAVSSGGSQDGRFRVRIWRSSDPSGANATEITSGIIGFSQVVNLSTSAAQISDGSVTLSAITLHSEYVFFQLAWEITGSGSGASADVALRVGSDAYISTPAFPEEIPGFYGLFYETANFLLPDEGDANLIDQYFMAYSTNRGQVDEIGGIQAGTLSVLLDDDAGVFDPLNSASPYYPNVDLKRGIQVVAQYAGVTYPRATVAIDSINPIPLTLGANVEIAGRDLYNRLLKAEVTATYPAQTDTARIAALMTTQGLFAISSSDGVFSPPAANLVKVKLFDHIDALVRAGRGQFWIGPDGYPYYRGRHERLEQESIGTFGAGGDYPFSASQPVYDDAGLYTKVNVRRSATGVNEVQEVAVTGAPTLVEYTLIFEGAETGLLFSHSPLSYVQAQLEALSTIGAGNVVVSGGPVLATNAPLFFSFQGDLALRNLNPMTIGTTLFSGGSSPAIAVSTYQGGVDPTQTASDATAISKYGEIPFDLDEDAAGLLSSDAEALSWAQWFLYQHKDVFPRFTSIQVDPWADPSNLWPIVLAADIGSVLYITHDLPGTTGVIAMPYYLTGIQESGTSEGDPDTKFVWLVSKAEADLGEFWLVGVNDEIGPDLVVGF